MKSSGAIGFSTHTGWAASVAIAGRLPAAGIVDRRRIRLADSDDTVRAQVYHRAARMKEAAASEFLRSAAEAAVLEAKEALRALEKAQPLVAAGLLTGAGKLPPTLAAILRSHPLIHSAEGVFYREALAAAAEDCGLEVVRIPRRELPARFAAALRTDQESALEWLSAMGRAAGPPWARDQKDAAMAAVVALGESSSRSSKKR